MGLKTSGLALVFSALAATAHAQSFEDVFAAAQAEVGDMTRYQEALQNPDQRFQYAMVEQMLKLEDPALQRIAKEHALFSTNPVMREAAIKAIMDSAPNLRLQIAGDDAAAKNVKNWIASAGGTFVNKQGMVVVRVEEAIGDDCWGSRGRCTFRHVGNTLQFNPGSYINAVLTLGNDGVMRGNLTYSGTEVVQVQIDLKE